MTRLGLRRPLAGAAVAASRKRALFRVDLSVYQTFASGARSAGVRSSTAGVR